MRFRTYIAVALSLVSVDNLSDTKRSDMCLRGMMCELAAITSELRLCKPCHLDHLIALQTCGVSVRGQYHASNKFSLMGFNWVSWLL